MTLAATGAYLVYAGIRNVPVLDGLRDLAAGKLPAPRPAAPTKVAFTGAAGATSTAGLSEAGSFAPGTGVGGGLGRIHVYNLGAVKSYVESAAYEIGPRFNITTIYGWAPGLYEHPKGRALDFMIDTPGLGQAAGDAVAGYVLANAARLNVMYVIWNRQSWNPKRGTWVRYTGSNPHTDHIHVSFN